MQKKHFTLLLVLMVYATNFRAQTYNFYFGNIHAHSSYSDGNPDSATSLMTKPIQDFNYAKTAQHIDFYGISEHNHFNAGMTTPKHYHQGLKDADSANIDGTFVALYGMEWGVISGGGHVLVYGYDSLIGWDNNDYDVYVAQNDYSALWKKINEKPGAFAYFAHPQSSDYSNLFSTAANISADNAIVGTAARSGPAFSTNTNYSDAPSGTYIARYNDALKRGYHLGVGLDHDTHNSVYGHQTAGRMVVLAQSLTRANILDGIRKMRYYSSDDWNLKVNFTIGNQPMGSIITQTGSPTIKANITDPDASENITSVAIYYGVPGSGSNPTILSTISGTNNISYNHTIANNTTYYYYLKITQNDGDIVWTSPIWYTRNDALTAAPPVVNFSQSSTTVCVGQSITFTDNTSNGPSSWNWLLPGALPNTSTNQNVVASYYAPGTYTVSMNASNAFGTSSTKVTTVTIIPLPNVVATPDSICSGQTATLTATGAGSYLWNTGSTNASIFISPSISTLYSVTGTLNGCSKSINTYVIVAGCVGIEEYLKGVIKLYPNPANNFITVDVKDYAHEKSIDIYDAFGKLIITKVTTETKFTLDVSSFTKGIYMIKVKLDDVLYSTQKFMIERE